MRSTTINSLWCGKEMKRDWMVVIKCKCKSIFMKWLLVGCFHLLSFLRRDVRLCQRWDLRHNSFCGERDADWQLRLETVSFNLKCGMIFSTPAWFASKQSAKHLANGQYFRIFYHRRRVAWTSKVENVRPAREFMIYYFPSRVLNRSA